MNSYSTRLAVAGAMIGVLALSATAFANSRPPGQTAESAAAQSLLQQLEVPDETELLAVMAAETEAEASFFVSLRVTELPPTGKLFLCDLAGCPLEELSVDPDGSGSFGPIRPGRYTIWQGAELYGSFRLRNNASLDEARGQLWTDGELLHFERFCPGTAVFTLRLSKPGYYSLLLYDQNGRQWSRDLFIPDGALPERDGAYIRVLEFRGLAPGLYTAVRRETPLVQVTVQAGEEIKTELRIEN